MLVVGCFLGGTVLAAVPLLVRDSRRIRRWRRRQEQRPLAERIAGIRDDASFHIEELQRVLEHHAVERPRAAELIPPLLEYYRRLAVLASAAETSPEEATRLAEEASEFSREHRIKGFFIAERARELAELLGRRKQD